jgi:hypothetical protein
MLDDPVEENVDRRRQLVAKAGLLLVDIEGTLSQLVVSDILNAKTSCHAPLAVP